MKIVYLNSRKDLKWFIKKLPKILHFEGILGGIKIITKGGVYMVKFKGEVKVESQGVGEWIKTHENGEHIQDFEFIGILVGYELEKVDDGDKKRDVVYFAGEDGKIYKTAVPQIYGKVKYHIKAGAVRYGDIVVIKYTGKEKIKEGKTIKFVNTYDIHFYNQDKNKEYVENIKGKMEDIPEFKEKIWNDTFMELCEKAPY